MRISSTAVLCLLSLTACDSFSDIERFDADEVRGRRGRKLEILYLKGQRVSQWQHADGGLKFSIERSINDYDEERVELVVMVENLYTDELRTTVDDLFIDYRGKRYRGFNTRWGWRDGASKQQPVFPPGESRRFCWAFPLFIRPETGTYTVTLTDVKRLVDGAEQALGADITFPLPVPGPKIQALIEYQ